MDLHDFNIMLFLLFIFYNLANELGKDAAILFRKEAVCEHDIVDEDDSFVYTECGKITKHHEGDYCLECLNKKKEIFE